MSSTTLKQKHFFAMTKAVQHGHTITGVSKETQADVHAAARSMTAQQVDDFQTLRPKRKTLIGGDSIT